VLPCDLNLILLPYHLVEQLSLFIDDFFIVREVVITQEGWEDETLMV
jgi:hypothetical protein